MDERVKCPVCGEMARYLPECNAWTCREDTLVINHIQPWVHQVQAIERLGKARWMRDQGMLGDPALVDDERLREIVAARGGDAVEEWCKSEKSGAAAPEGE